MTTHVRYGAGPKEAVYNPTLVPLNEVSGSVTLAEGAQSTINGPNPAGSHHKGRLFLELSVTAATTFVIDGSVATAGSPGRIAADGREWIGPLLEDVQHILQLYGEAAGTVHYYWWQEA